MDPPDTPRARRPLPTPGAPPQTPSTPLLSHSPVPAASFYASQKPQPPPLPSRHRNPGSSHTAFVPPPRYDSPSSNNSPGFREPELVVEDIPDDDDMVPDLIPQDTVNWNSNIPDEARHWSSEAWTGTGDWQNTTTSGWGERSTNTNNGADFDPIDYLGSGPMDLDVAIDGRNRFEEANWWNPDVRGKFCRPGSGVLAPVLAEELHDPHHSLFSVNVTSLPIAPVGQHVPPTPSIPKDQSSPGPSIAPSSSPPHSQHPPNDPSAPSEDEVRTSVPHPNAYYCPKDNGWVILSWKSSSVTPPLAQSYIKSSSPPLPEQTRRRRTGSCIDDGDHPFGKTNKTHHFHKYDKAVDSHKLTPPLRQDEWQSLESVKQKRRVGTIMKADLNINAINVDDVELLTENDSEGAAEEGKLLDLYVCCQCSFYCVASGVIPGVIPRKHIEELVRDKKGHPPLGKTGEQAITLAFETFLTAIENKLWKGNNRMIKVMSSGFQSKVGWNPNIKRIFELLGFAEEVVERDSTLKPPITDSSTQLGKQNRRKLLRAWLEISAWLTDFKRLNASHFKDMKEYKLYVQLDSAREMYQTAIGAHPDQIPRGGLPDGMLEVVRPLEVAFRGLGLTLTTFSGDLLVFAYLAQCRCDPAGTPKYFTYLATIVKQLHAYGDCPSQLQDLLAFEQSRERFTLEDVSTAAVTLGFGAENVLRVEYDDEIPDEFVENAWKDCVKRSWRDFEHGSETHRLSNDAFNILAETRGSVRLKRAWEMGKEKFMNPDRAYSTLEIPKDVDDYMLITVYNMRIEETPMQLEKMREAMIVIAEVRDSERLRQFMSSGLDPGDIVAPTRPDLPRGLNQLGNTCYLNSLLQYFYTIKDLREAVLPMSKLDLKTLDDEKLTDENLKRHRVGGRLVTRREITRSRKFINQLAELFFNLEYCDAAAVTPTVELAKLALITSRDEEEDEVDKGGTDSSNDTDATLVDDGPSRMVVMQSPGRSSSSVLGKRPRDLDRQRNEMEVDSPLSQSPKERDGFVVVPSQRDTRSPEPIAEASSSKAPLVDQDGDTNMAVAPAAQKPVSVRKRVEANDSTMMFGKQHDVAECMDNCMFQIETALLKFDDISDGSDKTSVVKSLFYGKIRQRLTGADAQHSRSSIHEKEDLFSHLPVNVTNDGVDIYDGLSGYFDDVVEFEGRKARMEVTLVDLPPVLQIQLQRVQFNRETLQPYKSQAYVKFGENLYMDRFMDTADPSKKVKSKAIQSELNSCRDRVRLLVEGKDLPFASSLEQTRRFLLGLRADTLPGIDDDVIQQLDEEKIRINAEIDSLRARIEVLKNQLEVIWADCTEAAYELTSVFIHRGSSPSWGHYFFYSRHLPGSPDSWFKYNDSDVTVVSKDEVLADTTGSTANPYLLVFARKGSDVVDTVKRFDSTMLDSQ
ncbi:hypothetical protein GALMADRAFT_53377 [Galerina marginata CBS 339.88]|uniref:ubiquitinyl hydrolase 1 n=1 Tax=Galerina marginata (strain CBS 339.88) TaxID=685588 RepID=A0A067U2F7_GALM3|nr:hypothetical protein GALMADRAFT_53377 [Galerina marginata CBS 339.88]